MNRPQINKSPVKVPMPERPGAERARTFDEVTLGYTPEAAMEEAARCLRCRMPHCISGCPVSIHIPEFITKVAEGDFEGAYHIISYTNVLPGVSGRVCPQERQCERICIRGDREEPVAIGRLERFVADWYREHVSGLPEKMPSRHRNVAVVGAGPAGLTCAAGLASYGYEVTVFEAFHTPGGVLVYGIPEFRLPKDVVASEIQKLEAQGVLIRTNIVVGKTCSVDDLFEAGFEAVFIGTGAGLPKFMGIPGESLAGVCSANEYLTRVNLMHANSDRYDTPHETARHVAVVGGGNVAMDAARCAMRLGAERVSVIYRRGEDEMPARREEIAHAKDEGIEFLFLTNPVQLTGDESGRVQHMECCRMELGEPDKRGRRTPSPVAESAFTLAVDSVIMALGTSPNPLIHVDTPGLSVNHRGCLVVDENGQTTRPGVFAGGDAVTGAATVILAMGAGKHAAEKMHEYLQRKEDAMKALREG